MLLILSYLYIKNNIIENMNNKVIGNRKELLQADYEGS